MGRLHKPEIQIPHLRLRPGQAGFPVDEKLQGTLEARLGESFKQVSDRLEQVYKGLGEMQTLAAGGRRSQASSGRARDTWYPPAVGFRWHPSRGDRAA